VRDGILGSFTFDANGGISSSPIPVYRIDGTGVVSKVVPEPS
jgi:hypothetical protein